MHISTYMAPMEGLFPQQGDTDEVLEFLVIFIRAHLSLRYQNIVVSIFRFLHCMEASVGS